MNEIIYKNDTALLLRRRMIIANNDDFDFPVAFYERSVAGGEVHNSGNHTINTGHKWGDISEKDFTIACCASWSEHTSAYQAGLWGSHGGAYGGFNENIRIDTEGFWCSGNFYFEVPTRDLMTKSSIVIVSEVKDGVQVCKYYKNGVYVRDVTIDGQAPDSHVITLFGDSYWGRYFRGVFYDFRVCSSSANATQISKYHRYVMNKL